MDEHQLDLAHEFPQFSDKIHYLKLSNAHFRKWLEKYSDINHSIKRSEQRIDLLSNDAEEKIKRERLTLKDELCAMLNQHY